MKELKQRHRILPLLIFAFFALINVSSTNAQKCLNNNGSFESVEANCSLANTCIPFGFNEGCSTGWRAANGTPDLCMHQSSAPPGGEDYFAVMGVSNGGNTNSCRNEAIWTPYDLIPGKTYSLTFYHRSYSTQDLVPFEIKVYQTFEIPSAPNSFQLDPCDWLNIPAGSEVIFSNDNFVSDTWVQETICFVANDYPKPGLLFVPEKNDQGTLATQWWHVDLVCLNEYEACEANTDLTACPDEDSYGFIAYDCPGDYQWEFPAGSTALEYTSDEHSVVLQASPGVYTVTITNDEGCEAVDSWEVVEECCEKKCEAPTGLECDYGSNKVVSLNWDEVPGALGYQVCIVRRSEECGCKNTGMPDPLEVFTTTTPYINIWLQSQDCFSWSVKTICEKGVLSEPSELMCFYYKLQGGCFPADSDGPNRRLTAEDNETTSLQSIRIFPNPTEKEFNIQMNLETESAVLLEIYDLQGKLIATEQYQNQMGETAIRWNPESNLSSGSYYLKITTDEWTTTERVVYMKK